MDTTAILDDLGRTAPDAHLIASQIVASSQQTRRTAPAVADLAEAITNVSTESHLRGAGALKLSLIDPNWDLLDSGIFSPNPAGGARTPKEKRQAGVLDPLDVNYPDGSRFWWRLSQVSPKADRTMQLTLIDRAAALLQDRKGPLKSSRSAMTRAEFLKACASRVHDFGGIPFYSQQLDRRQQVAASTVTSPASSNRSSHGSKVPGLGSNTAGLTVKGAQITPGQVHVANVLLAVANQKNASDVATVAMIYAAIWESALSEEPANSQGYLGALAGSSRSFGQHDTVAMAESFLAGGRGYEAGGAISLSRTVSNPVEVAVRVEVPSIWPSNAYAQESGYPGDGPAVAEAKAIVAKAGGAAGSALLTHEEVQPYYFTIGTNANPFEDFWTGMMRLAAQVNWPLFLDGDRMYYDSEMTLIRQKPAASIDRADGPVVDWNFDWENRHIVTQMTLDLICDPFEFRAGEVLELHRFGAASEGSTAGLPGRWLIADITRSKTDLFSQFTLKQPEQPKREPAAAVKTVTTQPQLTAGAGSAMAVYQASQQLSKMGLPYVWGGGHSPGALDAAHPIGFDCSGSTCWVLHKAGMWPSSAAAVSGELAASWGQPGQGKTMTVWANAGHVFIEFKIPGVPHSQMNTSGPQGPGAGPRLFKWGYNGEADALSGTFTPRHWPGS